MNHSPRVLLVEDDWAVRAAVKNYLAQRGMEVLEADCLESMCSIAEVAFPDVAVLDIVIPQRSGQRADFGQHIGIDAARWLRERFPEVGLVFLSAYVDRGPQVVGLFMEGNDRIVYLLKGSKPQELLDAIRRVVGGTSGLEIAGGVKTSRRTAFDEALALLTGSEGPAARLALQRIATLSEPEWRVFNLIGGCRTRQQAAEELQISVKTVASHMDAIYEKLGLREAATGLSQLSLLAKIHLLYRLQQKEMPEQRKRSGQGAAE